MKDAEQSIIELRQAVDERKAGDKALYTSFAMHLDKGDRREASDV